MTDQSASTPNNPPTTTGSTPVVPITAKLTPSVERASSILQRYIRQQGPNAQVKVRNLTVELLKAALNREEIARMLFIIDSNQPDPEIGGKVWDESPVDSPVKSRYRIFADGISMMVTGVAA